MFPSFNPAYRTVVRRTIRDSGLRVLVVVGLTAISIALVTGIGLLPARIRDGIDKLEALHGDMLPAEAVEYLKFVADGVERISFVFPALFGIVTALVVFMTISRLVTAERAQTGTLRTLGYARRLLVVRYLPLVLVGCVLGAGLGLALGYYGVAPVLFDAVADLHDLPETSLAVPWLGIAASALIVVVMAGVTIWASARVAREKPVDLLAPKAPKAGTGVLLEKVGPVWRAMPFRYKSTYRNIVRYRVRFVMTVFSMLLSTALVFLGLSLSSALREQEPELMDTIAPISTMLVVAAVVLNALVVYNITNINIEERAREIATLKVLGYRDREVAGYVFREILWLTLIGVAVGLPAGYVGIAFIFDFLQFGNRADIGGYVWFATPALALLSLALADLLLYRRLVATDMNASLRTAE